MSMSPQSHDGIDAERLRRITAQVTRAADLTSGNPGTPIREAIRRVAELTYLAEQARERAMLDYTPMAGDVAYRLECAVRKAQRALDAAVKAKPEFHR